MRTIMWPLLLVGAAQLFGQSAVLTEHRVMIPERGEVLGYMVSIETNHFSFLPPPEWRVSCKPGSKAVVMISPDLASSITIDFPQAETTEEKAEQHLKKLLTMRFAEAQVRETFACHTGIGEGAAFDIERNVANKTRLSSRVIYVTLSSGMAEFALTSPATKFGDCTITFGNVVSSFRRPLR
jgi:hypothetical protein